MLSKPMLITIILAGSIAQFSADLYLTSLPAISDFMQVGHHLSQLTITCFLLGLALSQLTFGPLSDKYGRRLPLIIGLCICMFGGVVCFLSNSIKMLLLGRFIQGVGAGAGSAITRSILRDLFAGKDLAHYMFISASFSVFVLALGPVIGGYVQHLLGWSYNFLTLVIFNSILIILTIAFCKETIKSRVLGVNLKAFFTVFGNFNFLRYSMHCNLSYAGIVAWLTATPIILQDAMKYSSTDCKWLYLTSGLGFLLGSVSGKKLLTYFSQKQVLKIGLSIALLAAALMLFLSSYANMLVIVGPIGIFMFGLSIVFPTAASMAMDEFKDLSGYASAVFGSSQVFIGMLSSYLMSYLPENTQVPLAITMLAISASNLLLVLFSD